MTTNSSREPVAPPSLAALWRTETAGLKAEWSTGLAALKAEWMAECRRADTPGLWSFASTFTAITAAVWLRWGTGGFHDSVVTSLDAATGSLRNALANLFGWIQ